MLPKTKLTQGKFSKVFKFAKSDYTADDKGLPWTAKMQEMSPIKDTVCAVLIAIASKRPTMTNEFAQSLDLSTAPRKLIRVHRGKTQSYKE